MLPALALTSFIILPKTSIGPGPGIWCLIIICGLFLELHFILMKKQFRFITFNCAFRIVQVLANVIICIIIIYYMIAYYKYMYVQFLFVNFAPYTCLNRDFLFNEFLLYVQDFLTFLPPARLIQDTLIIGTQEYLKCLRGFRDGVSQMSTFVYWGRGGPAKKPT